MPKVSGREVISEATEKSLNRLLLVSSAAIVSKSYSLPVSEMKMLGMEIPSAIFDVTLAILIAWYTYNYFIRWLGDLIAFRFWYDQSSIWSDFGTNVKIDKNFISGGVEALKAFNEYKKNNPDL